MRQQPGTDKIAFLRHRIINLHTANSDEYDDMQGKLSKLGRDLLNLSVKVSEVSDAVEALKQYGYQYNLNI